MTIAVVKNQINAFLATEKPEVIAIKGAWGIGKTYSWKQFLLAAKQSKEIALKRYSYVSLFGINSLEALKYAIFENVISRDIIGTEANIETFKSNTTTLLESMGRKSLGIFRGASLLKGFTPAIESLSFLSLNKSVICIDDLERRGTGLSIKDVLGLVSHLKEQKECKIVLLLNDQEDGLEEYQKYREKVIDIELAFAPTARECSQIAFDPNCDTTRVLPELTEKLNIRNIRVLKKIERLVTLARPLLQGYEPEISQQVAHSIVLFSWCYYCNSEGAPPLDFVTNLGFSSWGIGDEDDANNNDERKKWKTDIGAYGYTQTDELDLILAGAVRSGYFVEEDFQGRAAKKNEELLAAKAEGSFSKTWNLYHNSFDDNQSELVDKLYESFLKNAKNITPTNLNGTVSLFRELGESEKASKIIDHYISTRKDEQELFNMEENNFFGDIRDQEIVDKFNNHFQKSVAVEDARMVLARISGKDGWNKKDEIVLANTTEDEYYDIFKSEKGDHLSKYIRTCLRFGQFGNASEQQKQIAGRAIGALRRIAGESELNRRRVKKFGIDVENA
jgi:hypothetical protein